MLLASLATVERALGGEDTAPSLIRLREVPTAVPCAFQQLQLNSDACACVVRSTLTSVYNFRYVVERLHDISPRWQRGRAGALDGTSLRTLSPVTLSSIVPTDAPPPPP